MIPHPTIMGTSQGLLLDSEQLGNYCTQLKQSVLNQIQLDFAITEAFDIIVYEGELLGTSSVNIVLPIITEGMYTYSSRIPPLLLSLLNKDSSIKTMSANFQNWDNLYPIDNKEVSNSYFIGTKIQKNFQLFRSTFPGISIINLDVTSLENANQQMKNTLIAFVLMLNSLNYGISFSLSADTKNGTTTTPETFAVFFVALLEAVNAEIVNAQNPTPQLPVIWGLNPCLVKSLNPIYDIGGPVNNTTDGIRPEVWANALETKKPPIPDFTINGFIIPGFYAIGNLNGGDTPTIVQEKIKNFSIDPCIGGGFFATIDHLFELPQQPPPPSINDYANALSLGLNEVNLTMTDNVIASQLTFIPVNGSYASATNNNPYNKSYAFCSPIFTLEITDINTGVLITALPLQYSPRDNSFNIFPPNINSTWNKNGVKFSNAAEAMEITVELDFSTILPVLSIELTEF